MPAYYSQPAAANYSSPPAHNQKQRGYRICDQCGQVETPAVKFRLCGGCVRLALCPYLINFTDNCLIIAQMVTQYCVCPTNSLCLRLLIVLSHLVARLSKSALAQPQTYLPAYYIAIGQYQAATCYYRLFER